MLAFLGAGSGEIGGEIIALIKPQVEVFGVGDLAIFTYLLADQIVRQHPRDGILPGDRVYVATKARIVHLEHVAGCLAGKIRVVTLVYPGDIGIDHLRFYDMLEPLELSPVHRKYPADGGGDGGAGIEYLAAVEAIKFACGIEVEGLPIADPGLDTYDIEGLEGDGKARIEIYPPSPEYVSC